MKVWYKTGSSFRWCHLMPTRFLWDKHKPADTRSGSHGNHFALVGVPAVLTWGRLQWIVLSRSVWLYRCSSPVLFLTDGVGDEVWRNLPLPLWWCACWSCRCRLITDQRSRAQEGRMLDYWNTSAGSLPRSHQLPQFHGPPCFRGACIHPLSLCLTTSPLDHKTGHGKLLWQD